MDKNPKQQRQQLGVLLGGIETGEWQRLHGLLHVRLSGIGTCVLYSRDADGVISAAFASFDISGTPRFVWPWPGDNAVEVRAQLTGTCAVEVY
jgi:hypothetical protein